MANTINTTLAFINALRNRQIFFVKSYDASTICKGNGINGSTLQIEKISFYHYDMRLVFNR